MGREVLARDLPVRARNSSEPGPWPPAGTAVRQLPQRRPQGHEASPPQEAWHCGSPAPQGSPRLGPDQLAKRGQGDRHLVRRPARTLRCRRDHTGGHLQRNHLTPSSVVLAAGQPGPQRKGIQHLEEAPRPPVLPDGASRTAGNEPAVHPVRLGGWRERRSQQISTPPGAGTCGAHALHDLSWAG